ncbi:MAG TPA: NAD(P)-dependent oxidoreductase [Myxococcales bacterium]|nr:NAD(P)-dependent oxidoreductase [Myxococcales bacterium]
MAVPVERSSAEPAPAPVYPVFLRLDGRRVLLVGGGRVAASKLPALLDAGARVTVVAPAIAPELARIAGSRDAAGKKSEVAGKKSDAPGKNSGAVERVAAGKEPDAAGEERDAAGQETDAAGDEPDAAGEERDAAGKEPDGAGVEREAFGEGRNAPRKKSAVVLVERAFHAADLEGVSFVVAAAPANVNRAVALAAEARGLFVNAVDDAASASALLGGVIRKGGVTVAVSTGGRAPALAGLMREALEAVLPEDLDAWVSLGERVRAEWKRGGIPIPDRRPLLLHALHDLYATKEAP